eukprot:TRINITY_DN7410_c0_g1_i1.p2 TRINITY_DN7410_c0_g1~~TRINITY_DN7410_c0_g1_i1.p2  ORF type:complete len:53 (+),score=2.90 TRINITY_DN7410_c0_g1_i1:242-400(+)
MKMLAFFPLLLAHDKLVVEEILCELPLVVQENFPQHCCVVTYRFIRSLYTGF